MQKKCGFAALLILAVAIFIWSQRERPKPADVAKPRTTQNDIAKTDTAPAAVAASTFPSLAEKDGHVHMPADSILIVRNRGKVTGSGQIGVEVHCREQSALEQHRVFSPLLRDLSEVLGANLSGGIWLPMSYKNAQSFDEKENRPDYWVDIFGFDDAKSKMENIVLVVHIREGKVFVEFVATATEDHKKKIEPVLLALAKAAKVEATAGAWTKSDEEGKRWSLALNQ
ncbi:MAG: hypothetical protein Greene041619_1235 [Candidatus Peregrinibacteria bacterium Greene0416_19]|nr:MAG: hypothetical protein Greene041619_1235 [Candidatus Peregrinibacteria bacterium Greene0416_19]